MLRYPLRGPAHGVDTASRDRRARPLAVEFNGGIRSYYDLPIVSVYDDQLAQQRYEEVNARFRREIEATR